MKYSSQLGLSKELLTTKSLIPAIYEYAQEISLLNRAG